VNGELAAFMRKTVTEDKHTVHLLQFRKYKRHLEHDSSVAPAYTEACIFLLVLLATLSENMGIDEEVKKMYGRKTQSMLSEWAALKLNHVSERDGP
jgi:hypothetical protein